MIKQLLLISLLLLSCSTTNLSIQESQVVDFTVNLNDRSGDTFKVEVNVSGLKATNNIFQFASTAPGTYQVMDIGRFVSNFKAYNSSGNEVASQKISTNQYELSKPSEVVKITYQMAETFDTPVTENQIYPMCGTSIEDDHVLINGQAVFAYFKGRQSSPIRIKLNYPKRWKLGTALKTDAEGRFLANSYDHLVDSPILLGNLTKASMKLGKADVDIFTFSKKGMITSDKVLNSMRDMLIAADKFVDGLPVDRYTFLYLFDDKNAGAWEHSYSSAYVLREDEWSKIEQETKDMAAHEFFHIVTPLNIHSEVVHEFNFIKPVPSKHLWLYEATTEWASHMMQLRSRQTSLEDYTKVLRRKVRIDNFFDTSYTLENLALNCFTPDGQKQYGNIYYRGALVMAYVDLTLLELSGGKRGLREVVNELAKKYGPNKPFDEATFYEEFIAMTDTKIGEIFEKHIKKAELLPYKEMYAKVGILYEAEKAGATKSQTGLEIGLKDGAFIITNTNRQTRAFGYKEGDFLLEANGEKITMQNMRQLANKINNLEAGTAYTALVKRDGKEILVNAKTLSASEKYVFSVMPNASSKQLALREAWMKEL